MIPSVRRLVSWVTSLDEASMLCFGAAAGFGIVGGAAWLAAHFMSRDTHLVQLIWIGMFYVTLGSFEQVKAKRSGVKNQGGRTPAPSARLEVKEEQESRKAA